MVEIKKFQRGHRTYTRWGNKIKEVKLNQTEKQLHPTEQNSQPKQINFKATEEQKQGKYTNYAIVSSNETEFTLDFFYQYPSLDKAEPAPVPTFVTADQSTVVPSLIIRLIANPVNTKRLAQVLQESIARYEKQYGKINV